MIFDRALLLACLDVLRPLVWPAVVGLAFAVGYFAG
jgi:hypothetical protein